jgi:dipeptidase
MNWQDMYEVALERIRQLNREVTLLGTILRAYLPVIEKDEDEKR